MWYDHVRYCTPCGHFDDDWKDGRNVASFGTFAHCELCGEHRQIRAFIPEVITDFYKTHAICWICKNTIIAEVNFNFGLCWGNDSYDLLKWGLVHHVANWIFRHHFSWANGSIRDFKFQACCFNGAHYRLGYKPMASCSAIGCRVNTKMMFCGPHYRWLPKFLKDKLKQAGYTGKACIEIIEYLAERERKEITLVEYTRLENRYGKC